MLFRSGRSVDYSAGRNRYVGYLISLSRFSFKGMKVGLDCSNGSTFQMAKSIFDALGAKTYVISNAPDGTNINMGCGSTHIEALQQHVRENHLDIGFAFDGDADRCLAVDETGKLVDGDLILYLCGRHLQQTGMLDDTKIVTTVMSNFGLYKALDELGIGYEKTAVGDKYVYECMKAGGHYLGGEQSGHIIFSKYATTGDGMMTAIMVMQVLMDQKQPLSKLVEDVIIYPQVLKNVRVTDKDATLGDPAVQQEVDSASQRLEGNGRILLRKSGTEPVLRVMAEAPTYALCEQTVDAVIDAMRRQGHLIEVK